MSRPDTSAQHAPLPTAAIVTLIYAVLLWFVNFLLFQLYPLQVEHGEDGRVLSFGLVFVPQPGLSLVLTAVHTLLFVFIVVDLLGHRLDSPRNRTHWIASGMALAIVALCQVVAQRYGVDGWP